MSTQVDISRRHFLKHSALTGGGLIVGIPILGLSQTTGASESQNLAPNAILQITPDN